MAIEMDIAKGAGSLCRSHQFGSPGWRWLDRFRKSAPPVLRWPSPAVVDDRGKPVKA